MWQVHKQLGDLTPPNFRHVSDVERRALFLRRAAAELAYQAWMTAPEERQLADHPLTDEILTGVTTALVAAEAAFGGYTHPAKHSETSYAHAHRQVRIGVALGWRLARMAHHPLEPR